MHTQIHSPQLAQQQRHSSVSVREKPSRKRRKQTVTTKGTKQASQERKEKRTLQKLRRDSNPSPKKKKNLEISKFLKKLSNDTAVQENYMDAKKTPRTRRNEKFCFASERGDTRKHRNPQTSERPSDHATKAVATNECPCGWEQATFPLTESFFTKAIPPNPTTP
jgi:hypothetical protein